MKKKKFLVETSAVRAIVGPATDAQANTFRECTKDGALFTSAYIRMEFIRRWICSMIEMATVVHRYDNVQQALTYLEQSFSPRAVKSHSACIQEFLLHSGNLNASPSAVAEELARTAFHWLRRFDKIFPSRIQNRARCRRGNRAMPQSFVDLVDSLNEFYVAFSNPILDCEVNGFVGLSNRHSVAQSLVNSVTDKQVPCLEHLRNYVNSQSHITCKECERIGDVIISLEQTRSYILAHVDGAFKHRCEARNMPHISIPSVLGAEKTHGSK